GDGIRWRQCDLEDFAQAAKLVGDVQPQVIFHLGGKVTAAPDLSLVLPTLHSLLTSSVNLLTLATEHGCRRVVFVASMEEPYGAEGATIDLGSGTARSVREIVERLVRLMDSSIVPLFGALPDRPGGQVRVARLERASTLLGWRPSTPLDAGLGKTIEWYRAH